MVEALAELPETMREVVVLKHSQGLTLQQIADRIGKTVPDVASLLRRGLAGLRDRLKTEESPVATPPPLGSRGFSRGVGLALPRSVTRLPRARSTGRRTDGASPPHC
jgi:DNA-binding CsgD family transcriptional regulator